MDFGFGAGNGIPSAVTTTGSAGASNGKANVSLYVTPAGTVGEGIVTVVPFDAVNCILPTVVVVVSFVTKRKASGTYA